MSNPASLEMRFIGVLKELHKRNLMTCGELGKAIKAIVDDKKQLEFQGE